MSGLHSLKVVRQIGSGANVQTLRAYCIGPDTYCLSRALLNFFPVWLSYQCVFLRKRALSTIKKVPEFCIVNIFGKLIAQSESFRMERYNHRILPSPLRFFRLRLLFFFFFIIVGTSKFDYPNNHYSHFWECLQSQEISASRFPPGRSRIAPGGKAHRIWN